jgi:predicted chitinase
LAFAGAVHCSDPSDTTTHLGSSRTTGSGGASAAGGHGGGTSPSDAGATGGTAGATTAATSSSGGAAGGGDTGGATGGAAGSKGGAGGNGGGTDAGRSDATVNMGKDARSDAPADRCAAFAAVAPGCTPGSFCELFTEGQYNCFFPQARAPYSYAGLVSAADKYYSAFTRTGDPYMRKREAAAFLANIAHETVGLQYAEEVACANGKCFTSPACAPYLYGLNGTQKCYDGRGAIQLTTHENYRLASTALAGLGLTRDLESNPELVATDPEIAIATAIWFWMARTNRTIGCHTAIVEGKGFGVTVIEINGPIECGVTQGIGFDEWKDRLNWFGRITSAMGIDVGDISGCN